MNAFIRGLSIVACVVAFQSISPGAAQEFPNKLIRIIVPYAPGGGSDIFSRLLQPKLRDALGQVIIIENRPGAGSIIGAEAVARSAPDGYTLLFTLDSTMTMNPALYADLPYDPFKDFAPISMIARGPLLHAVNPHVPARTMGEMVAYLKANPGKLNMGSGAITGRVTAQQIMNQTGTDFNFIPYAGGGVALSALWKNEVQFGTADIGTFAGSIKEKKLYALAVSGKERFRDLPDVPTLTEQGYGSFDYESWWALFAPAGTPKSVIEKIHSAVIQAMTDKDIMERFISRGAPPWTTTPEGLAEIVRTQEAQWRSIITKAGIRAN